MAPATNLRSSFIEASALDSEDDLLTTTAATQNAQRASTAANKMVRGDSKPKTTATTRRASTAAAAAAASKKRKAPAAKTANRQALQDRTNLPQASDTEDVDEFGEGEGEEEDVVAKFNAKRAKIETKKKPVAAKKPPTTTTSRSAKAPAAAASNKRAVQLEMRVIPETQPSPHQAEDISHSIEAPEDADMDIAHAPTPPQIPRFIQRARSTSAQSAQQLQPRATARSASAGYNAAPVARSRSGSASGAERVRGTGGDAETRRKLAEVTKKYENLHLKYLNLQAVGEESAQSNFEKLRRATEQKDRDGEALVAGLRREVEALKKTLKKNSAKESGAEGDEAVEALKKQVAALTASNGALAAESANLKASLQGAQNETKAVEVKLVAARAQLSNQEEQQKSNASKHASADAGSGGVDALKEAKMKENLYSDLTGLIVRGVKRKEGEDEYDCLQTGRNGTLHFHLSIAHPGSSTTPNPRMPSGLSYEEAEFAYEPLLDEGRDRELIELLPDYLTEEICFPRGHAVKFYTRVVESMTRRIVVEE